MIASTPINDPTFLRQQIRELRTKARRMYYQAADYEAQLAAMPGPEYDDQVAAEIAVDVCRLAGGNVSRVFSRERTQHVALTRALIAYVLRRRYKWSLHRIGRALGRDHTSIVHLCRTIDDRKKQSMKFAQRVQEILDRFCKPDLEGTNAEQGSDSKGSSGLPAGTSEHHLPAAQVQEVASVQDRQRLAF